MRGNAKGVFRTGSRCRGQEYACSPCLLAGAAGGPAWLAGAASVLCALSHQASLCPHHPETQTGLTQRFPPGALGRVPAGSQPADDPSVHLCCVPTPLLKQYKPLYFSFFMIGKK